MDRTDSGTDRGTSGARESGAGDSGAGALFRPGREFQRLAEDWAALRRDAFLLNQKLLGVEARLVAIEGRSTGDAHAKLALLTQVLRHDLGLAPDHRALRLASGALAALECVHRAVEPERERPPPAKTQGLSSDFGLFFCASMPPAQVRALTWILISRCL